jgi:hypothetical protein
VTPSKASLVAAFLCLLLAPVITACKKAASISDTAPAVVADSSEAKQARLEWDLKTLVEPYEHAGHTNPSWDTFATNALTEFARSRAGVFDTNEA